MEQREELIRLLRQLQGACIKVTFRDGGSYMLKIVATMHAEEGGDMIADVLRTIQSAGEPADRRTRAAMDFKVDDVAEVEKGGERLFPKQKARGDSASGSP